MTSTTLPVQAPPSTDRALSALTPTVAWMAQTITSLEMTLRVASLLMKATTMPAHVKNEGDAVRVVIQAAKWGMEPFSVAECTSLVHGRLCFEGKLVAAAMTHMRVLEGHLDFAFAGEGQGMSVVVTGKRRSDGKVLTVAGTVKQWRTHTYEKEKEGGQRREIPNNWDKNPQDQLIYKGTRQWCRLWTPEVMLGVYTPDELEEVRDVTAESTIHDEPPRPGRRRTVKEAVETVDPKAQAVAEQVAPPPATTVVHSAANPEGAVERVIPEGGTTHTPPPAPTMGQLQEYAREIWRKYAGRGKASITRVCGTLQVATLTQCPGDQIARAIDLLKAEERALIEGVDQ